MKKNEIQKRLSKMSKQTVVEAFAVLFEKAFDTNDHEPLLNELASADQSNRRAALYKRAKKVGMV